MGTYRHIYKNDFNPEIMEEMEHFIQTQNPLEETVRGYYATLQILRKYKEPEDMVNLENKKMQKTLDSNKSQKRTKYLPRSRRSCDEQESDNEEEHVEKRPKKKV